MKSRRLTATTPATKTSTETTVSHDPCDVPFASAYTAFCARAGTLLNGRADEKGYAARGDGRDLMDFIADRGLTHAEGEIIYKVLRWHSRRNPEDLQKIAAWAFLEYDRHQRKSKLSERIGFAGKER